MSGEVLRRKIARLASIDADSLEMREAMDALSAFYDEDANTVKARRTLRLNLENQGLELAQSFLSNFGGLRAHLQNIDENIQDIDKHCKATLERLEALEENRSAYAEGL